MVKVSISYFFSTCNTQFRNITYKKELLIELSLLIYVYFKSNLIIYIYIYIYLCVCECVHSHIIIWLRTCHYQRKGKNLWINLFTRGQDSMTPNGSKRGKENEFIDPFPLLYMGKGLIILSPCKQGLWRIFARSKKHSMPMKVMMTILIQLESS